MQLTDLSVKQAQQAIGMPIELLRPFYSTIRGYISREALWKVEEQHKLSLKDDLPACTGMFYSIYGATLRSSNQDSRRTKIKLFK